MLCCRAVDAFHASIRVEPRIATYIHLGKLLTQLGRCDTALQAYMEALELDPDNAEVMSSLGLIHLRHAHA